MSCFAWRLIKHDLCYREVVTVFFALFVRHFQLVSSSRCNPGNSFQWRISFYISGPSSGTTAAPSRATVRPGAAVARYHGHHGTTGMFPFLKCITCYPWDIFVGPFFGTDGGRSQRKKLEKNPSLSINVPFCGKSMNQSLENVLFLMCQVVKQCHCQCL